MMPFNNCPQTTCRPRFRFGRASGFFGRWIRCQRPFQAVAGHDFVRATSEQAAAF
jgi:hypothetical protein